MVYIGILWSQKIVPEPIMFATDMKHSYMMKADLSLKIQSFMMNLFDRCYYKAV